VSAISGRIRTGAARVAGSGVGAALVLALMAGLGGFAVTAMPRLDARVQTRALRDELVGAGPATQVVTGTDFIGDLATALYPGTTGARLTAAQLAEPEGALRARLSALGIPVAPGSAASWSGLATLEHLIDLGGQGGEGTLGAPVETSLSYRSSLADQTVMIAGSMPDHAVVPAQAGQPVDIDVAISQATATAFSLHLNDVIPIVAVPARHQPTIEADVVGIFRPLDPAGEFWTYDPLTATPQAPTKPGGPWLSESFVGPDELAAVQDVFGSQIIALQYGVPLNLSQVTAAGAQPLINLLNQATSDAAVLPQSSAVGNRPATIDLSLATGPSAQLTDFVQQSQAVGAVLSLVFGSLAALGAAVLLLCVLLLGERRSAELALLRTRGASARQLAALGARVGAAAAVPALLGALLALALVAGPGQTGADLWPVALIAAAAVLGPALSALHFGAGGRAGGGQTGRAPSRRDRARRNRARRIVTHSAVILFCVGSVALERLYGAHSGDLLTSTAPFLLAVPIALALYYVTPFVIRMLTRIAARRRGAVSFIGLARASRGSAAALLPSFALVLALSVLAVGAVVHDTVTSGEVRGSWAAVGADDLITAAEPAAGFAPGAASALAATRGVERSATATVLTTNDFTILNTTNFPDDTVLLLVDPSQYDALTAGTPVQQLPAALSAPVQPGAPIPFVASPAIAAYLDAGGDDTPTLEMDGSTTFTLQIAASRPSAAALPGAADFIVLPRSDLGQYAEQYASSLTPNLLMLDGPVDGPALTATLARTSPGATVVRRADALAALTGSPFQSGTFDLLDLAMLAAVLLAITVLLAGFALGAAAREAALARLATMGLSRGQGNRLVAVENLPALVGALLGGAACTVAIGALVGAGIDLSVFTGTGEPIPLNTDPWTLAAAGGALAATAALTLIGHTIAAHRRGVTAALRLGEQ
jgi:putative ABC transport system permease protein